MQSEYKLFAAVVDEGNLAAAGRRLGLSRSMVSKILSRMEERLGAQLLYRNPRRVALTGEGEIFYREIVDILEAIRDAENRVASSGGNAVGELTIHSTVSIARHFFPLCLTTFMRDHPNVFLNILVEDLPFDLTSSRDLEISFVPSPSYRGTVVTPLMEDHRILCASPEYIRARGLPRSPDDLHDHDVLAPKALFPLRFAKKDATFQYHGRPLFFTNSSDLPGEFALAGAGIALRPLWMALRDLREGRLIQVLPDFEYRSDFKLCAIYKDTKFISNNIMLLLNNLKEFFRRHEKKMIGEYKLVKPK